MAEMMWKAMVTAILVRIAETDLKKRKLPDRLTFLLFVCGTPGIWLSGDRIWVHIIGAFAISTGLFMTDMICPGAVGGGDIKYMAAAGWMLGLWESAAAFCVAVLLAGGYCAFGVACGRLKRNSHIALGPFLCAGTAAALWL